MTPARPSLASRAAPLSRARARRYAHRLSTVLLARGQDAHLFEYEQDAGGALRRTERPNARDGRGWPYYEQDRAPAPRAPLPSRRAPPLARQAMSALFKLAPPAGGLGDFEVPGSEGRVEGWRKAITVGGEGGGGDGRRPPLAPSRFAAQLKERKFTNDADLGGVCELVRRPRPARRTPLSYPPRTPRTPLHPSLRSTSERCATASAHAIGWRTVIAAGPMRRRRSWA